MAVADHGTQCELQDFDGLTVGGLERECRRMGLRSSGLKQEILARVKDEAVRREGFNTPADRHRLRMEQARRVHGISSGSAAAGPDASEPRSRLVGVSGGHSFYADAW